MDSAAGASFTTRETVAGERPSRSARNFRVMGWRGPPAGGPFAPRFWIGTSGESVTAVPVQQVKFAPGAGETAFSTLAAAAASPIHFEASESNHSYTHKRLMARRQGSKKHLT